MYRYTNTDIVIPPVWDEIECFMKATLIHGMESSCLSNLKALKELISDHNREGGRAASQHRWPWCMKASKTTLHRSVTHSHAPGGLLIGWGGLQRVTEDDTNFRMMQPCKPNAFIQSRNVLWNRVNLGADILLLLRGSPLASVSTQLCSAPRVETKDETNKIKNNQKQMRHSRKREKEEAQL